MSMHIGLTYDLRSDYLSAGCGEEETAEFDRPDTIDAIEGALVELGHEATRIGHARQLIERLAAGGRWDVVFNICEGLSGMAREAQVPAILDVYGIPCTFADAAVMSVCLNKELTKTVVRAAGVPTPRSAVIERLEQSSDVDLSFPLFAKPIAEGTGKGISSASKVADATSLKSACRELLARYRQPVLVEEYLPGREFTVGLLGGGNESEILGTLEIILLPHAEQDAYSYANKENCEELVEYRLVRPDADDEVRAAQQVALAAWRALGCRDAGRIDLRSDATGRPQFLEANPLAGLHPWHSDLPMLCTALGVPYVELIRRIVEAAAKRVESVRSSMHRPADAGRSPVVCEPG